MSDYDNEIARIKWMNKRTEVLAKLHKEAVDKVNKQFIGVFMTKGKLFQYAILFHPTEEEYKNGKRSTILVPVKTIIAVDEKSAAMIAARDIPKDYEDKMEQVDLAIQPF